MVVEKNVEKNDVASIVLKTKCFNLQDTLECGQCFRWERIDDGSLGRDYSEYIGVISDRVLHVKQEKDKLYVTSNVEDHLKRVVQYYFDLYNNYDTIEEEISKIDENIKKAVGNTSGIHILNQAQFETIISYIISSNNNIPRIKKSIAEISKRYGTKVEFEGKKYYLFPTIDQLSNVTIAEFKECGVGFRDKYLVKTIADLKENNVCDECNTALTNSQLRKILMSFVGVGPKVADCVMLFSFGRQDVFPIDVWVKRAMENLYMDKECSIKEITRFANDRFGSYSGIVQQHLFHNIRNELM
ncbi:MAG: 8-oxoguanine DNA glycosylase [Clostridia bacterium]|nr:8-oxoguanine DNA glycosylase [Clostridia bacterium]